MTDLSKSGLWEVETWLYFDLQLDFSGKLNIKRNLFVSVVKMENTINGKPWLKHLYCPAEIFDKPCFCSQWKPFLWFKHSEQPRPEGTLPWYWFTCTNCAYGNVAYISLGSPFSFIWDAWKCLLVLLFDIPLLKLGSFFFSNERLLSKQLFFFLACFHVWQKSYKMTDLVLSSADWQDQIYN